MFERIAIIYEKLISISDEVNKKIYMLPGTIIRVKCSAKSY